MSEKLSFLLFFLCFCVKFLNIGNMLSNFVENSEVMSIWQRIVKFFKRESTTTSTSTTSSVRSGGVTFWYQGVAGGAMAIATVYRCVQVLADRVAGLHLQYLKLKNDIFQEDFNSPLSYLLSVQPMPEMSIMDFWTMAMRYMLLQGNAYIYPRKVLDQVTDLCLCNPMYVSHDTLNNTYTINDPYAAVYGTFKEDEIIHLYLYSSDGRRGESVLAYARKTLGIADAGDAETGNRFANGGTVKGFITNEHSVVGMGLYDDDELDKTAEDVDAKFQDGKRIVSLPAMSEFKQISLSSTDMQFLETRKFTVAEICRFFGVNPSFVFAENSNYKSVEMANRDFLTTTLDPILKRIEAEFNRKLIYRSLWGKRVFRFNRMEIYSLDLVSLADYQKKTIESGLYTVNDWRKIQNQPRVEGGDKVYVSTNLAELGSNKLSE